MRYKINYTDTLHNVGNIEYFIIAINGALLLNTSSCARHTMRPNKQKRWSLEQRKVYSRTMQGEWVNQNDNPPQYSCLENSMDRGAWWATVHGVAEVDMTEELTLHTLSPTPKPQTPHRVEAEYF